MKIEFPNKIFETTKEKSEFFNKYPKAKMKNEITGETMYNNIIVYYGKLEEIQGVINFLREKYGCKF